MSSYVSLCKYLVTLYLLFKQEVTSDRGGLEDSRVWISRPSQAVEARLGGGGTVLLVASNTILGFFNLDFHAS